MTSFSPNFSPKSANLQSEDFFPVPPYPKENGSSPTNVAQINQLYSTFICAKMYMFNNGTDVFLTKLSAASVEGPSNSDHMGIWLAAGQVLHRDFFIDLKILT